LALIQPEIPQNTARPGSWTSWDALQMLPEGAWEILRPLLIVCAVSLIIGSVFSFYLAIKKRSRIALVVVALAVVPVAFSIANGIARTAPQFSLADVARFLNSTLSERDAVVFEGELDDASSLVFYLRRQFYLIDDRLDDEMRVASSVNTSVDESAILRHWGDPQAIFLIIDQSRIPHWQHELTTRFHIYHQVMTNGRYVVLSNQL
jgi:hypothetical protein